jgi:CRISPR-associated exonuclease Cas4
MQTGRSPYGAIKGVKYKQGKLLFPISWLQKQDYCEYQIYLENIRGIQARPTPAMTEGKEEHERLYTEFAEKAVPATVEQMLTESLTVPILSREFRVEDLEHGLYGYIDEVRMGPDAFVVIDDKPGVKIFLSSIHQVLGYCLAFKTAAPADRRQVIAALRERGTDNVYWQTPFDASAEEEITLITSHVHDLLTGKAEFKRSTNSNKCRSCRLKLHCSAQP